MSCGDKISILSSCLLSNQQVENLLPHGKMCGTVAHGPRGTVLDRPPDPLRWRFCGVGADCLRVWSQGGALTLSPQHGSEAADVDHRQLVGHRLEDVTIVMGLPSACKLASVRHIPGIYRKYVALPCIRNSQLQRAWDWNQGQAAIFVTSF